jgi:hypothetical protein
MATTFLSNRGEMRKTYGEHSIYASRKISLILAKQFQRRRFVEIDQPEIRIVYGGHVCSYNIQLLFVIGHLKNLL